MLLPYTVEVYVAAMAQYNAAWLPAAPAGLLLALAALALAWRPPAGEGEGAAAARLIGAVLAAAWLWVGAVHQLQHMAGLNFLAPVYGWLWIANGALIALAAAFHRGLRYRCAGDARGRTGLTLALFGLLGYPLAVLFLDPAQLGGPGTVQAWRALPLAGTAPAPTAIFTAGLLLAARPRPPLTLFVLPLGWAGVAAVSAWLLAFPLDYTVTAAVLAAATMALWAARAARARRG